MKQKEINNTFMMIYAVYTKIFQRCKGLYRRIYKLHVYIHTNYMCIFTLKLLITKR